jgi:hypothetical protein
MAASLVGSASTGGATTGTSFATTNPQSPTALNTLILAISCNRANATYITLGGLSGWMLMGEGTNTSAGTQSAGVHIYAKIAAGGDTAPTITTTATSNLRWLMEEWSGLSTTLISTGIPITGDTDLGSGALTLTQSRTSVLANEFQYGLQGGRGATSNPAVTWGGGLTADYNTSSGQVAMLKTSTGTIASAGGTMNATCDLTNNQGTPITGFVMVPFNLAGGSAVTADVSLTGTNTVTATATKGQFADTTLTGTAAVTAAAIRDARVDTTLAGTGTVTAAATKGLIADATLTGTGTVTADATRGLSAAATLAGTAAVTASAILGLNADASLAGVGTVDASATVDRRADTTLTGTLAVSASATVTSGASADADRTGTLTVDASATVNKNADTTLAGVVTVTGSATVDKSAAATLPAVGIFTVDATVGRFANAQLAGTLTVSASAAVTPADFAIPRNQSATITSRSSEAEITTPTTKAVIT